MSVIRYAEEKDIPAILDLLVQVNMVHHLARPDLFKATTKYGAEELKEILQNKEKPVFVYEDETGAVLGHCFGRFQQTEDSRLFTAIRTFYIDDICVDEKARGSHVGSSLFAYAKAFAEENGCYNITLNVWSGNDAAKAFYENCGMQVQKTGMEMILKQGDI